MHKPRQDIGAAGAETDDADHAASASAWRRRACRDQRRFPDPSRGSAAQPPERSVRWLRQQSRAPPLRLVCRALRRAARMEFSDSGSSTSIATAAPVTGFTSSTPAQAKRLLQTGNHALREQRRRRAGWRQAQIATSVRRRDRLLPRRGRRRRHGRR